jgi:hypothetical protein
MFFQSNVNDNGKGGFWYGYFSTLNYLFKFLVQEC